MELVCPEATSVHCQNKIQCKKKTPSPFQLEKYCFLNGLACFGKFMRRLFKTYSRWKDCLCSVCKNITLYRALCSLLGCLQGCSLPVERCFQFCLVFHSLLCICKRQERDKNHPYHSVLLSWLRSSYPTDCNRAWMKPGVKIYVLLKKPQPNHIFLSAA